MQKIVEALLAWYAKNARELPWRRDREPYHVWVSEIMLQQTRVAAVCAYYQRFLSALPDISALALCSDAELMKLWEGLGYYRRARSLKAAAVEIMARYNGVFPGEYEQIRALPGIGPYTAGAISSICFEEPRPAVDGNVLRIMSRLLCSEECVDAPRTVKRYTEELAAIYPIGRCGDFSQALMELGACVCTPGKPHCEACPVRAHCLAFREGKQEMLPVRAAKKARRQEERSVFLLLCGDRLAIRKRPERGLLGGLWELPAVQGALDENAALEQVRAWGLDPLQLEKTLRHVHVFTHIEWHMRCFVIYCRETGGGFTWTTREALQTRYALPSAFRPFLTQN